MPLLYLVLIEANRYFFSSRHDTGLLILIGKESLPRGCKRFPLLRDLSEWDRKQIARGDLQKKHRS